MIALIPVSRFRVDYELASGRPYSKLEEVVLHAIGDGIGTKDDLKRTFEVHPRLVTEAIVTLIQAGWVALAGPGLVLTAEGQQAVEAGGTPRSISVVPAPAAFVVLERVSGLLASNLEVRYRHKKELGDFFNRCVRLDEQVLDNVLDEAQVQGLLPSRRNEWIRWIGPIHMTSRHNHFVPVEVDLDAGVVRWLPGAWTSLQVPLLEASRRWVARHGRPPSIPEMTGDKWGPQARSRQPDPEGIVPSLPAAALPVLVERDDLICGGVAHDELFTAVLRDAKTSLIIASAFLSRSALERFEEALVDALQRGVSIDLLWGYAADGEGEAVPAIDWCKRVAYGTRESNGRLRWNRVPSGSHAKLLVWDRGDGAFEAVVGSRNWLSAPPGTKSEDIPDEVSLRVHRPGLVALVARAVAAVWAVGAGEALSAAADRWRRTAANLSEADLALDSEERANCTATVVFDRQHEHRIRQAMIGATQRILVVSHRVGPVAATRVKAGERVVGLRYAVLFSETDLDDDELATFERLVSDRGGLLVRRPGVHTKALVADDTLLVGSYNPLSTDPFGTASRNREVSILLTGEPAGWVWDLFGRSLIDAES